MAPLFRDPYRRSFLSDISIGVLALLQIASFISELYYLLTARFDEKFLKYLLLAFVIISALAHYGLLLWKTIKLINEERNPDGSVKPEYYAIFCFHPVFWFISFARLDLGMLLCDSSFTNFLLVFVYYTRKFEDAAAFRVGLNFLFQTIPSVIIQSLNNTRWQSFETLIMTIEVIYLMVGMILMVLFLIDRRNAPRLDYSIT